MKRKSIDKIIVRIKEESGDVIDVTFDHVVSCHMDPESGFFNIATADNKITRIKLDRIQQIEEFYSQPVPEPDDDEEDDTDDENISIVPDEELDDIDDEVDYKKVAKKYDHWKKFNPKPKKFTITNGGYNFGPIAKKLTEPLVIPNTD